MDWKTKYGGILLVLVVILVVSGIALATLIHVYKLTPTVQRLVSENYPGSFSVATGYGFTKTQRLDLALPASYDLTYTLSGDDNDLLENEKATIWLDYNEDENKDSEEPSETIALDENVTFQDVDVRQLTQVVTISATARGIVPVIVDFEEGDQDLGFSPVTTNLWVEMVPKKTTS